MHLLLMNWRARFDVRPRTHWPDKSLVTSPLRPPSVFLSISLTFSLFPSLSLAPFHSLPPPGREGRSLQWLRYGSANEFVPVLRGAPWLCRGRDETQRGALATALLHLHLVSKGGEEKRTRNVSHLTSSTPRHPSIIRGSSNPPIFSP